MSMNKVNKKDNLIYGSLVRKIIRKSKTAVLSSYLNGSEWPYGSLVLSCCEHDGSPYVFISDLAEHTKAIRMNNKVSIFYENCNFLDDPLTGTRFSMLCKAFDVLKKEERRLLLNRFVLRHPESKIYSKFNDFNIFKLSVEKIHVIFGFGKIRWLNKDDVIGIKYENLINSEKTIIDFVNNKKIMESQVIGVDPEGYDFINKKEYFRNEFSEEIKDEETAKIKIMEMIKNKEIK